MSEQPKPNPGAQLETVIIFTPRMEELARFYQQAFDLGEYNTSPRHLGQQIGPVYLGFDQDDDMTNASPSVTLWFTVDDIQATYKRLLALGARDRYPPTRKPWGTVLAAVYDPDGNMVGLSQRQP
ncbi:MAG: VOC family protein [Candidatus Deferrimicrobiaceae bacterium]